MPKIAILGYGNVGYHFSSMLSLNNQVSIFSRQPNEDGVNPLSSFSPDNFDFIFLTVSDDSIKSVADSFSTTDSIVVHTSGSRPISDLENHKKTAVIYPLQTFTREKTIDPKSLRLFVESSGGEDDRVMSLATEISSDIRIMNSADRGKIHLAAVFACNFSNHMFHIAENFLKEIDLKFQDIHLLVEETVKKAIEMDPSKSQTGPAIRNDVSTLAYHENLIEDERVKELYQIVSKSIQQIH